MEMKSTAKKWITVVKNIIAFIFKPNRISIVMVILSIILGILLFIKSGEVSKLRTAMSISNQNIIALHDTLKLVKNKNGEYQQEKAAFIVSVADLKKINSNLYREVKKQKDQVLALTSINANLHVDINNLKAENKSLKDSIRTQILANGDTVSTITWDLSKVYDQNNSRTLKGETRILQKNKSVTSLGTELTGLDFKFNIITGIVETKDKQLNIFIKSDYPDLKFADVQGALIDPKKSKVLKSLMPQNRWVFGPQLGVGFGYSNGNMTPTCYVGFGVVYRLFGF